MAPHIQARGVGQAHATQHQGLGLPRLVGPLEFGQLDGVVDAGHLCRIGDQVRRHRLPIGAGKLDHIGQVVLLLGVVVVQARQPCAQPPRGHGHDAAVNFSDGALIGCGVFFFHDGLHLASGVAHDAPVTRGLCRLQGQERELLALAGLQQSLQGVHLGQRYIARQHQGDPIVLQQGHGLLHGMSRSQLGHLARKTQARLACQSGLDLLGPMAGDGNDVARR